MSDVNNILNMVEQYKIVPVIAIDSEEQAVPLADALIKGGLPLAEITFRTPAAAAAISRIKCERPEMIIGAGTVLTQENLAAAMAAGAAFGVAPGLNADIVREASKLDFPFIPGIMTPSEMEEAMTLDCHFLKFFPAGDAGGPKMLKSLSGPYSHMGLKFMPTGGVTLDNMNDYLALSAVAVVGGTWLAKREDIAAGNWAKITANCREALKSIK